MVGGFLREHHSPQYPEPGAASRQPAFEPGQEDFAQCFENDLRADDRRRVLAVFGLVLQPRLVRVIGSRARTSHPGV